MARGALDFSKENFKGIFMVTPSGFLKMFDCPFFARATEETWDLEEIGPILVDDVFCEDDGTLHYRVRGEWYRHDKFELRDVLY